MESTRRARRLLRFYPPIWRERYGDEFVDFMEQSIAENPHDAKRTTNIVYKSAKVRLSDVGVVGTTLDQASAPKVALSTSTFLASIFAVFALFYWSCAMVSWNSNPTLATTFAESIWMGAITVSTMLLTLTLLAIGLTLLVRATKKAVLGRERRLLWPLLIVLGSTAAIVNSVYQYNRWVIARGGIDWSRPGIALKQLAGSAQWITQSTIWGPSWAGWHLFSGQGPLHWGTPIAVFALVLGVAKLARRLDFSPSANRSARIATTLLSLAMTSFLLSFLGWTLAGGFDKSWMAPFTQMETSLFLVIAFIAILTVVTTLKNRTLRNAIEVVDIADVTH
jgi:hypothetical protein